MIRKLRGKWSSWSNEITWLVPLIDDEIAVKWCDNFIKDLDPQKYYFLKADVEEFKKEAKKLDDQIREGNIDFARKVFERFLKRSDERFKTAMELLKQKFDFTVDESLTDDPEKIDYPVDKAEADGPLAEEGQAGSADRQGGRRARAMPKRSANGRPLPRSQPDVSSDRLERAARDLLDQLDEDLRPPFLLPRRQEPGGHAQPAAPPLAGGDRRVAPIRGRLCGRPGGRARDGGRQGRPAPARGQDHRHSEGERRRVDLVEKKLNDVVRYIRGPRGTKVRLIVQPDGTKERRIYELTREKIELKEQHAKGKVIEAKAAEGKNLKIGIINLPAFYGDTDGRPPGRSQRRQRHEPTAASSSKGFKTSGVDAVMIDLRGNGGGLLEEAKTLSGLFIDTGPVVQVKDVFGVKHLDDDEEGTAWDGPLVVLIDKASASASEIFAG